MVIENKEIVTRIASAALAVTVLFAGAASYAVPAAARERAKAPPKSAEKGADKPAETTPEPVSAEPQTTTASFGDWVVRCVAVGTPAKRSCEASQALVVQYQGRQVPFAQIAFGRTEAGGAMQITALLPVNISFDKPARIGPDEAHMLTLPFRRCLPSGCYASAAPDTATIDGFRGTTKPGRLAFTDGGGRTLTLPLSLRGLAQALDNLGKQN